MSNSIQLLSNINSFKNISSLNGFSSCSCKSSGAFDTVLISLLNAIKENNRSSDEETKLSLENIFNNTANINSKNLDIQNMNKDERIESAIQLYSEKYDVDSNLIKAIIKVESNFDPNVVSSAGAKGLMQLMPENCEAFGVTDPFNIEQNIEGGVRHIKEYIDRYNGDIEMALMAYNGGPTRMMKRGVNSIQDIYKMPKETQNYVPKVMKYYKGL